MTGGRILFVTGTDTGVGKTWVACGLVRALRARGCSVGVRKPAETGCEPADAVVGDADPEVEGVPGRAAGMSRLRPADAEALLAAAGGGESIEAVCPYRFAEPLAPAVAAARAGRVIDVDALVRDALRRAGEVDLLLVEGAGGLLVPLAPGVSFAGLAASLGARVLVVVGARLGAINHALLTVEAARRRSLDVVGLVVNHFAAARDLATETLVGSLGDACDAPVLATLPHGGDPAAALDPVVTRLLA